MDVTREVTPARARRLAHVPALDGLRGVAVAGVLAFHAGYLQGGYLGVDLFFVLSGFLITSLLVIEWSATGRISLRNFYARRLRRLLPAVLLVVAVVGVLAHWEVLPTALDELRASGLATLAYVANWHSISSGAGYWNVTALPSWLQHTWSLAIEEQFYAVWPLVAILVLERRFTRSNRAGGQGVVPPGQPPDEAAFRRSISRLGRVAGGLALAMGLATVVWAFAGEDQQRLYLGTDTRAAAILLGCWAACRQQLGPIAADSQGRRLLGRLSLGATFSLAIAWISLNGNGHVLYRGGLLACGLAATVVILDVTTPGSSFVGERLDIAPLRSLGAISYGLYLWHWPIFQFLYPGRYDLVGTSLVVVRVGVSLVVSVASYVLLEQPIRRGYRPALGAWSRPRHARRERLAPAVAPLAVGACVLALVLGTAGGFDIIDTVPAADSAASPIPARLSDPTPTDPAGAGGPSTAASAPTTGAAPPSPAPSPTMAAGTPATPAPTSPPTTTQPPGPTRLMVVGDSVGYVLARDGLTPEASRLNLDVQNRADLGCSLMLPVGGTGGRLPSRDCSRNWRNDVAVLHPDVVLVVIGHFVGTVPARIDGADAWPCSPAWDQQWQRRLDAAVDVLGADGATVVLATAPTASLRLFKGDDGDLFDRRQGCSNAVLRRVARLRKEAVVVDVAKLVCPDNRCHESLDGNNLRVDGLHFSGGGALALSARIGPELADLTKRS